MPTTKSTYLLHEGDCLEWLRSLPSDSVDSLVTDPPAGITFMGRKWDDDKGGRKQWIAWLCEILRECKRVMKPGAAGFVWALPRTSHWTGTACEDAGFEVRDVVTHLQGQGFPKSKSLLKPSSEHWILIRKPGPLADLRIDDCRVAGLADKPFGKQRANRHFDSSKDNLELVEPPDPHPSGRWPANAVFSHTASCVKVGQKDVKGSHSRGSAGSPSNTRAKPQQATLGKFNKQSVVEHVNPDGKETVADWRCAEGCAVKALSEQSGTLTSGMAGKRMVGGPFLAHARDAEITVYSDTGTAARFYHQFSPDAGTIGPQAGPQPLDLPTFIYQAKASRSERERGCEGINDVGRGNTHVSVKPLQLMRHLCRLVTPVGGTVIDPFAGSGTTGCAAMLEGLRFLGAEREPEYIAIARARIGYYATQSGRVVSDGVAPQKKSIVAPQKNATKLRSLSTLPKRVI
jgi:site-specific DNA-methyltransferase (adenine-specific)